MTTEAPARPLPYPSDASRPRILVVDDDADQIKLVTWRLSGVPGKPYTVEGVASADAGLTAVLEARHHAYLIDQRIGRQLGTGLIKQARSAGSRAPLLIMTAHRDAEADRAALAAGADDFLIKGEIDVTALDRTLRYAIRAAVDRIAVELARTQVWALEQIGTILSEEGPTAEALQRVVARISDAFGYEHLAIYLMEDSRLALAAQQGYAAAVPALEPAGMLAHALRAGRPRFVPNVSLDPDHRADGPASELCVPLLIEGEPLGALLVGSPDEQPLGELALAALSAIGQRIALAAALDREHRGLQARNRRFRHLARFARLAADAAPGVALADTLLAALVDVVAASGAVLLRAGPAGVIGTLAAVGTDPRARPETADVIRRTLEDVRSTSSDQAGRHVLAVPVTYARRIEAILVLERNEPLGQLEREAIPVLSDQLAVGLAADRSRAEGGPSGERLGEVALLDSLAAQDAGHPLGLLLVDWPAGSDGAGAPTIATDERLFHLGEGRIAVLVPAADAHGLERRARDLLGPAGDVAGAAGGAVVPSPADVDAGLAGARGALELARRSGGGVVIA